MNTPNIYDDLKNLRAVRVTGAVAAESLAGWRPKIVETLFKIAVRDDVAVEVIQVKEKWGIVRLDYVDAPVSRDILDRTWEALTEDDIRSLQVALGKAREGLDGR